MEHILGRLLEFLRSYETYIVVVVLVLALLFLILTMRARSGIHRERRRLAPGAPPWRPLPIERWGKSYRRNLFVSHLFILVAGVGGATILLEKIW